MVSVAFIILIAAAKIGLQKRPYPFTLAWKHVPVLVTLGRIDPFIFVHLTVGKQMASRRCFYLHPIPSEAEHPLPIFLLGLLLFGNSFSSPSYLF